MKMHFSSSVLHLLPTINENYLEMHLRLGDNIHQRYLHLHLHHHCLKRIQNDLLFHLLRFHLSLLPIRNLIYLLILLLLLLPAPPVQGGGGGGGGGYYCCHIVLSTTTIHE